MLPDMQRLPGFLEEPGLESLLAADEFERVLLGELLQRFDGLVGADHRLAALLDAAGESCAPGVDVAEATRELRSVIAPRRAGVHVQIRSFPGQGAQFADLHVALRVGLP